MNKGFVDKMPVMSGKFLQSRTSLIEGTHIQSE